MPKSNGRPKNRVPKKWRIKESHPPYNGVTTYPFAKGGVAMKHLVIILKERK